ncbi:hypothetical protein ACRJ4W_28250 [Streptomyces sp. GLT-R25]
MSFMFTESWPAMVMTVRWLSPRSSAAWAASSTPAAGNRRHGPPVRLDLLDGDRRSLLDAWDRLGQLLGRRVEQGLVGGAQVDVHTYLARHHHRRVGQDGHLAHRGVQRCVRALLGQLPHGHDQQRGAEQGVTNRLPVAR